MRLCPQKEFAMSRHRLLPLAVVAAAFCLPAAAQPSARDGKQVVTEVCALCHATGRDGAPAIGDKKAWARRAERGLTGLTQTAIAGLRKMPPHGGKLDITDLEIRRAIAYMVNESGGKWTEPIDRASPPKPRGGADIVNAQCIKCHGTGEGGAPRLGDKHAWVSRAKDGFESLVQSAIRGHGGMPSRGGMADLTDAEMRSAIAYLFQASVREQKK
jgi:cytochrome c5